MGGGGAESAFLDVSDNPQREFSPRLMNFEHASFECGYRYAAPLLGTVNPKLANVTCVISYKCFVTHKYMIIFYFNTVDLPNYGWKMVCNNFHWKHKSPKNKEIIRNLY